MWRTSVVVLCAVQFAIAAEASGQTPVTVSGRVYAADTNAGIQNAIVVLEGFGSRLTAASGAFRFDGVAMGVYRLRVEAFGFAAKEMRLTVETDAVVEVPLEPVPFVLDSISVSLETIDVRGQVVDRGRDREVAVVNAQVLGDGVPSGALTDAHGGFELENVTQGVPLRITVRAFGYLPASMIVLPSDDSTYVFDLEEDPVTRRMIDVQVGRLEDRAALHRGMLGPMNREDLLRFAGRHTLRDVIESEYPTHLDAIVCALVDERRVFSFSELLSTLSGIVPEEVERLEFISSQSRVRGSIVFMLRVYTRRFVQEMIARDQELRDPIFILTARPPICR